MSIEAEAGGTALGAAALGWYALGGLSMTDALAAVGGPEVDSSAPDRSRYFGGPCRYAQLRVNVRALIDGYEQVATMFASSVQ